MYYKCCVCKRTRQDAILYHFPCSEERLKKWLKFLNRDDLKDLSQEQLTKLFVCRKHFEGRFSTSKDRLKAVAYPSLFTDNEILSGIPSSGNTENIDPQADHSYSRKRHFDHSYCMEPLKEVIDAGLSVLHCIPGTSQNPPIYEASVKPHTITSAALCSQPQVSGVLKVRKAKTSRKRLIERMKALSPTCQMLYNAYNKAKKLKNFHQRANRALKFNKEKAFEKITKNMNPYARTLLKMQINLCCKKKGYRFTTEEKIIALSILKQSPKCYKFLQKIFIMPSRSTLNKMVAKLHIQTGICPQVFNLIKKEVAEWDDKKKICSIIFDEMALESGLSYDKNKDVINGFVELGEKKKEFADHALVFMLRGAIYKWQQPIGCCRFYNLVYL